MGGLLFLMLAGGLGGLIGWAVTEPFAPDVFPSIDLPSQVLEQLEWEWGRWGVLFSFTIGAFIGLALGAVNGWMQCSRKHLWRGALGGLVVGAIGGYLGLQLGGTLAHALFGPNVFTDPGVPLREQIIARTLVFAPFGALLGLTLGIAARSWPRAVQGMIGGLIGGVIGGALFDIIGSNFGGAILAARGTPPGEYGEVGILSRAVASVTTGAAIGLFVGIVERLSRKAWLRLELGRNEGREWIVDASQTFIGRSETAHVPLFGDPNIAPMHACIYRKSGNYTLVDGGAPMGIGVNGIRVPQAVLKHGDIVNIGSYNLRFLLRGSHAAAPAPVDVARSSAASAMGPDPAAQPVGAGPPPQRAAPMNAPAIPQDQPTVQTAPPPPAGQPQYALVALDGPISGQRFPLGTGEMIAGREAAGIQLSFDQSASRRHAAFVTGPAGVMVRDLGSTNGTLVNSVRVQEMALRPGDTVKIGSTTFRLE
ncbi:MAG: FHA domain-containing protein [Armatimonadetes bacterium]|nr:FHA domain-containing protein [Armatimonadota bacterium]